MDISKNTQLDLLYLTNPKIKFKYNNTNNIVLDNEDVKFYRKRILQDTKEYLRGKSINIEITNAFEEYACQLIKHYKFIDKKDLIQEEYKDLPKKKEKKPKNFKLNKENELLLKKPEIVKKTIKDFIPIVVKERTKKKIIIPKQKKYDIKQPKNIVNLRKQSS